MLDAINRSIRLTAPPSTKLYLAPIRGMDTSVPEWELPAETRYSPSIVNFLPTSKGTLRKRKGYKYLTASTAPSGKSMLEFFERGDASGAITILALADDGDLYFTKDDFTTLSSVADAIPGNVTVGNNAFFAIAGGSGSNVVFVTAGYDFPIKKWPGATEAVVVDMAHQGFADLKANVVHGYGGYLILANTKEQINAGDPVEHYPYRFRWSKFAGFEDFRTGATSTAGFLDLLQDDVNGPIQTVLPLREVLAVYKQNSVYNVAPIGDGEFSAELKCANRGAISPKAVAPIRDGNYHVVVSYDNIYVYDGSGFQYPALGDKIKNYFYSTLDWEKTSEVYVKSIPWRQEVWIFYPDGGADKRAALCFNWQHNAWTVHTLEMRSMFAEAFEGKRPVVWGSDMGTTKKIATLFHYEGQDGVVNANDGRAITATIRFQPLALVGTDNDLKLQSYEGEAILDASLTDTPPSDRTVETTVIRPVYRNNALSVKEGDETAVKIVERAYHGTDLIYACPLSVTSAFYMGAELTCSSSKHSEEIALLRLRLRDSARER